MTPDQINQIADAVAKKIAVPKAVFNREESARYIGLSPRALDTLAQDGVIPRVQYGDMRCVRFAKTDLDHYIATSRVAA
jgi:hypothetical protein